MSPDLDVLLAPLHGGYGEWLYHRGTTHSLWFGFVVGPLLGWLLWRWRDNGRERLLPAWIALSVVALVTHPLLDGFTPYGTQFLAPFARTRFTWNGVAIVDPFYSVVLAAGLVALASRRLGERAKVRALALALIASTAYLLLGIVVNRLVVDDVRRATASVAPEPTRIRAYPTVFQPWLRGFVVHTEQHVLVGLHSWWEVGCPSWVVHPRPAPDPGLAILRARWPVQLLEWFADGDVGVFVERTETGRRVRFEDLRYAWASPSGHGFWGVEARLDARDRPLGAIERFERAGLGEDDTSRVLSRLLGRLPGPDEGYARPVGCVAEDG